MMISIYAWCDCNKGRFRYNNGMLFELISIYLRAADKWYFRQETTPPDKQAIDIISPFSDIDLYLAIYPDGDKTTR